MTVEQIFALIPPQYAQQAGYFVAFVVALRTVLRSVLWCLAWLDKRLDGKTDWTLIGAAMHALDRIDHWAGWAAVSALLPKPSKDVSK